MRASRKYQEWIYLENNWDHQMNKTVRSRNHEVDLLRDERLLQGIDRPSYFHSLLVYLSGAMNLKHCLSLSFIAVFSTKNPRVSAMFSNTKGNMIQSKYDSKMNIPVDL